MKSRGFLGDAFQNRLKLYLEGDYFDGGVAVFSVEGFEPEILEIPPRELAVLAVLAEKLKKAVKWTDAYLSARELAMELEKLEVIGPGIAQNAQNIVYLLRQRLNATKTRLRLSDSDEDDSDDSFAKLIVPHRRRGYTLGIAPENISLNIEGRKPPRPM